VETAWLNGASTEMMTSVAMELADEAELQCHRSGQGGATVTGVSRASGCHVWRGGARTEFRPLGGDWQGGRADRGTRLDRRGDLATAKARWVEGEARPAVDESIGIFPFF